MILIAALGLLVGFHVVSNIEESWIGMKTVIDFFLVIINPLPMLLVIE